MEISSKHLLGILLLLAIALVTIIYYNKDNKIISNKTNMSFTTNIIKETENNTYFRKVLFTGMKSQLVVMDIPPGGEVGEEVHKYTEQTLFFLSGRGKSILDGKEGIVDAGDVVVVTPGTKHNFINTGSESLKIYTVYTPPNHIDGRVHTTKEDADKDIEDEAVGERMQ